MSFITTRSQVNAAQISLVNPNKVFGNRKSMYMGKVDHKNIYRILFNASVAMIPEECTILKAVLRIYVQFTGNNTLAPFTPYALKENWSAKTLTWNNQPAYYPSIKGESLPLSKEGFYCFNITRLVSKWYCDEIPNHGLIMINDPSHNRTNKQINTVINSNLAPMIEISYMPKCEIQVMPTRFIAQVEELDTDELFSFSSIIDTSLTKMITYHVENLGGSPVEIRLQVSANLTDFINDSTSPTTIGPHEIVYAIPYTFSKYLRIAARNIHPGETSKIKIWYQAQE